MRSKPRNWVTWKWASATSPRSSSWIVILEWPSIRVTGSMTISRLMAAPPSATEPGAGARRACGRPAGRRARCRSGRRTAGSRAGRRRPRRRGAPAATVGRSGGTTWVGDLRVDRHVLEVGAVQQRRDRRSGCACPGTLDVTAQSPNDDERLGPLADLPDLVEVLLAGDGALDEADVDVLRELLDVDERAVDEVGPLDRSRAAARPCRAATCGSPSSRRARRWRRAACSQPTLLVERPAARAGTGAGSCCRAATARPFSNRAPVGQTWTHLPQLVQVVDSPHGVPRSVTGRGSRGRGPSRPRCGRPRSRRRRGRSACTGCSGCGRSRTARWLASMSTCGLSRGRSKWVEPELLGRVLQLAVVVGHADRADVVALDEQHLDDRAAVLQAALGVGA